MGALLRSDYVKIQYLFLIDAGNIVKAQFFVSNLYVLFYFCRSDLQNGGTDS